MKTEELLEKYFDGQTTCEEERELRRFFASDQVPGHLEVYRPLFACIDREAEAFRAAQKEEAAPATHPAGVRKPTCLHRLYYLTTGIAAALLLCIGIAGLLPHVTPARTSYAIIDGRYCDDPQLVQAKALEALQNVGFTDEELKETITLPNLLLP
ncbi:hypothetical protein H7U35_00495 [Mediterranea massiliensis]|uniref:Uncharacterized protein n=1 Tax=Mediterranea massiliensis TaxID=1841865 RepID=A0ABS2DXV4_9BACT|nr:hypothetical protein [Mediterranea massiliensis]MBM6733707.1 hypothetical protein [Mediterranea massiliensis]